MKFKESHLPYNNGLSGKWTLSVRPFVPLRSTEGSGSTFSPSKTPISNTTNHHCRGNSGDAPAIKSFTHKRLLCTLTLIGWNQSPDPTAWESEPKYIHRQEYEIGLQGLSYVKGNGPGTAVPWLHLD